MFERFTPEAKDLVIEAQAQRAGLADERVGTEHLLLALLVDRGPAGQAFRRLGLDADEVGDSIRGEPAGDRPASDSDDELLGGLGIDVEAIRESLDEAFGPGALDRARGRRSRESVRTSWRRRAEDARRGSGWDSDAKYTLECALREALRLKTRHIGPEHIGLGLLADRQSPAYRFLVDREIDPVELSDALEAIACGATKGV